MRGVLAFGTYRPAIRVAVPGVRGHRIVCSYDEDTTTMAVEAGRAALAALPDGPRIGALTFVSTTPAYADKNNATAVHAALSLADGLIASDAGSAARSAVGALRAGLRDDALTLTIAADMRSGLPGSPEERNGSDGAAALVLGDRPEAEVLAEHLGSGSRTLEFLDRWRLPLEPHARAWEERFSFETFLRLSGPVFDTALLDAGVSADEVGALFVTGANPKAVNGVRSALARRCPTVSESPSLGDIGAASGFLELSRSLAAAEPGTVIAWVSLADGVDVEIFRAREPILAFSDRVGRPVEREIEAAYLDYLTWRDELGRQLPRRPDPAAPAPPPSLRSERWKFGLVGSACERCGRRYAPPQRRCVCGALDEMAAIPLRDVQATVATHTLDYLAFTPQPPIIAASIDLDGGGRMQIQMTDARPDSVAVGDRVEMTFRRLYTSAGAHNYFWKARPVVAAAAKES